jgi:hypothetical protein
MGLSMKRLVPGFAFLSLLAGLVCRTEAAPPDLKQVAADAKWIAHVDYDAMKQSVVVRKAWEALVKRHPEAEKSLEQSRTDWGIDPVNDLHGTTVYGKKIGDPHGVMIVQARADKKILEAKAEGAPDHKVTEYGPHKIHGWTHKDRHGERPAFGAFHGDEAIVFASSADDLKAALDVLDGRADSLLKVYPNAGEHRLPDGTILFAGVRDVADAQARPLPPLLKQVEMSMSLLGEHDGKSFYRSRTVMTSEETAAQAKTALEGFRALGLIHAGQNEKGQRMVRDVEIEADGKRVSVSWDGSADDVWDMIVLHAKAVAERRAAKK